MKIKETLMALLGTVLTLFLCFYFLFKLEPDKDFEVLSYIVEGLIILCMGFFTAIGWTVAVPDAKGEY